MPTQGLLIALDSVGIDPLGHNRPESVYSESSFLFPKGKQGALLTLPDSPVEGALVETDVTGGRDAGAIECAITYTAHFTGQNALERHGLMQGLGLKDRVLEDMVAESNLFRCFPDACLANAIFPAHLPFLGGSYVEDLVPHFERETIETGLRFRGEPVRLSGRNKQGLPELFTLAEINQNIFVHAAREAGLRLRTYDDVRAGTALTSSMTHELESEFDLTFFGQESLPRRTPQEAAEILAALAAESSFVFYKYQIADLVSHSGKLEKAREVFGTIEQFVGSVLEQIDPAETFVVVTSDHGHLEQVEFHHGHPKTKVPTWCFGHDAAQHASKLQTPQAVYHLFAAMPSSVPSPIGSTTKASDR